MFRLTRPTGRHLDRFLREAAGRPLSYAAVGATAGASPAGYLTLEASIDVGDGEAAFERAVMAMRRWHMFSMPWLELVGADESPHEDMVVGLLCRSWGLWFLNACRVVELFSRDEGGGRVEGFAYGTVHGHVASGEERFWVHMDPDTERVRFHIRSFSRPAHLTTRVAERHLRTLQRRFLDEAMTRMESATRAP